MSSSKAMMKFRAKMKGDHEGHEGHFVYLIGIGHDFWNSPNGRYYGAIYENTIAVFTGLVDINGKEIYGSVNGSVENGHYGSDIVKFKVEPPFQKVHGSYSLHEIVYRNGMWIKSFLCSEKCWDIPKGLYAGELTNELEYEGKEIFFTETLDTCKIKGEVIGEVHGNPELYEEPPYFNWCDVDGCGNEGCSGGNAWRETGYWKAATKNEIIGTSPREKQAAKRIFAIA